MNCKKGDLAVVVRSALGNEGIICEVISFISSHPIGSEYKDRNGQRWAHDCTNPKWLVRSTGRPFNADDGKTYRERPINDFMLRPIRDQPGADESLTWVRNPVAKELVRA